MQNLIGSYTAMENLIKIAECMEKDQKFLIEQGIPLGNERLLPCSAVEQVRNILMSLLPYVDICQKQLDFINNLALEGFMDVDAEEFNEYVKPANNHYLERKRYEESTFLLAITVWDKHHGGGWAEVCFADILEILTCFIAENPGHADMLTVIYDEIAEKIEAFCAAGGTLCFDGSLRADKTRDSQRANTNIAMAKQAQNDSEKRQEAPPKTTCFKSIQDNIFSTIQKRKSSVKDFGRYCASDGGYGFSRSAWAYNPIDSTAFVCGWRADRHGMRYSRKQ
jgi:hypothetical protein